MTATIHLSNHLPQDGSDCRPALQALISDPANAGATFVIDMTVSLQSSTARFKVLRMDYPGQKLVGAPDGSGRIVNESTGGDVAARRVIAGRPGADGLEFRDFSIESHTPDPSGQSALFHFSNAEKDVAIERVRMLRNEGGDAVYFGSGCDGQRVEDCFIRNFYRMGVVLAGWGDSSRGYLVRNNDIGETPDWHRPGRPSIKMETKNEAARHTGTRIVGNRCSGQIQVAFAAGEVTGNLCETMAITGSKGLKVSHNRIRYGGGHGPWAVRFIRFQQCEFVDNVIETAWHGIVVEKLGDIRPVPLEWEEVWADALLSGGGNDVLLVDGPDSPTGTRYALRRPYGPAARDELEDPTVWVRQP